MSFHQDGSSAYRLVERSSSAILPWKDSRPSRGVAGLEATLTNMMHEHAHRTQNLKERAEKSKKEALHAANSVSEVLMEALNADVRKAFFIEKQIAAEAQALSATIQRFAKQTNQWLTLVDAFNVALKEVGDFENWIKVMEYDCESIASAVQHVSLVSGRQSFS